MCVVLLGQFVCCCYYVCFVWQYQEGCVGQWCEGIGIDYVLEWCCVEFCFDDGSDYVFIYICVFVVFVQYYDVFGVFCLCGNEGIVEWCQLVQVDYMYFLFQFCFEGVCGMQCYWYVVVEGKYYQVVGIFVVYVFFVQCYCFVWCGIGELLLVVVGFVQIFGYVQCDWFEEGVDVVVYLSQCVECVQYCCCVVVMVGVVDDEVWDVVQCGD